jgi:hypothetical protein
MVLLAHPEDFATSITTTLWMPDGLDSPWTCNSCPGILLISILPVTLRAGLQSSCEEYIKPPTGMFPAYISLVISISQTTQDMGNRSMGHRAPYKQAASLREGLMSVPRFLPQVLAIPARHGSSVRVLLQAAPRHVLFVHSALAQSDSAASGRSMNIRRPYCNLALEPSSASNQYPHG